MMKGGGSGGSGAGHVSSGVSDPDLHSSSDGVDGGALSTDQNPDHSLKIFKADQSSKFLLVNQNTSAREVVMLALTEFGISENSSNYHLVEVSGVSAKTLHPNTTNLAERIGLASRYYIKNVMSSEQLIPEDVAAELAKESKVDLIQLNPLEVAIQLMVEDFTIFSQIETTEYIDKVFELKSRFGIPNLTKFEDLVNKETKWVITEILSETSVSRRVKVIKQFIKIAQHCYKQTKNFNSMSSIVFGLEDVLVTKLRSTWARIPGKYKRILEEMVSLLDPARNFSRYRHLIQNSSAPLIPYYPIVSRDVTFIHLGNKTKVDGDLVNFEKLRMLAKEVRNLNNMCSAPLDLMSMLEQASGTLGDSWKTLNSAQSGSNAGGGGTIKRIKGAVTSKESVASAAAAAASGLTGSSSSGLGGGGGPPNARKMYEEAQMVRRVKAYINKMPVIFDDDELQKLAQKCEPSSSISTLTLSTATSKKSLVSQASASSLKSSSTSNVQPSTGATSISAKRMPSPSPSNNSTNSSTSMVSHEGRKSSNSQAQPKFGKLINFDFKISIQ